jgi:hypothetical protein
MKLNSNRSETNASEIFADSNSGSTEKGLTSFCLNYCRKLITEIQEARVRLLRQFQLAFRGQEQMLRLALNEAEALAFLTDYPHLVFPTLALEKVQGAAAWQNRQQQVTQNRTGYGPF